MPMLCQAVEILLAKGMAAFLFPYRKLRFVERCRKFSISDLRTDDHELPLNVITECDYSVSCILPRLLGFSGFAGEIAKGGQFTGRAPQHFWYFLPEPQ